MLPASAPHLLLLVFRLVIGRPKGVIVPSVANSGSTHPEIRAAAPRRRLAVAAAVVLSLLATGCLNGPMSSLHASGPYTASANRLFEDVFYIVVLVFVLVEGAIVFFLFKYRERPGDPMPVQIHGHTKAEFIWTVIPAVILAAVAIPTIKMIFDFAAVPPASERIDACVTGHQWWWEYQYMKTTSDACPAGGIADPNVVSVTTANELHIPVGKKVYLDLRSVDVVHSFWVPQLNGKQDLIPGHTNHITIEADKPGVYLGQCSQFCGLSHANMRLRVIAMTPADYQNWLMSEEQPAATPTSTDAQAGLQLFLGGRDGTGHFASAQQPACSNCHTIDGTSAAGVMGPNLTHLEARLYFAGDTFPLTNANLVQWLTNPPAMKPGVDMPDLGLTPTEINELVAYLDTLK